MTFQEIILKLHDFWKRQGCIIVQPYWSEVGAGTFNPATFLRVLGPEPWRVAYVEPSRRPYEGRYGENPFRTQHFYQYQVVLKPSPDDVLDIYFQSLMELGLDPAEHDIRLEEDDWESPTLGAWGLGWQVLLDGMEITQFTYFQQAGGIDLKPISAEITYGLERLAMYIQNVESFFDLEWGAGLSYGEIRLMEEVEFSRYNFEEADIDLHFELFNDFEREANRLLEKGLILPAYDFVVKMSHIFNMLEARGAISVTERTSYIARIREVAGRCAAEYLAQRERMGFPLLKRKEEVGVTG